MTKKEFQETVSNAILRAKELMDSIMNDDSYRATEDGELDLNGINNVLERLGKISSKGQNFAQKDIAMYSLIAATIDLLEIRSEKHKNNVLQCESALEGYSDNDD